MRRGLLAWIEHSRLCGVAERTAKRRVAALREQILSHALEHRDGRAGDVLRSALAEDPQPYGVLRPDNPGYLPEETKRQIVEAATGLERCSCFCY